MVKNAIITGKASQQINACASQKVCQLQPTNFFSGAQQGAALDVPVA